MENIIDDLNYRGLIEQYSNPDKVRELLSKPTTIYCGFDPSAASMHLGNFVMISLLMRLQKAGHRIIAVVGGATGMSMIYSYNCDEAATVSSEQPGVASGSGEAATEATSLTPISIPSL